MNIVKLLRLKSLTSSLLTVGSLLLMYSLSLRHAHANSEPILVQRNVYYCEKQGYYDEGSDKKLPTLIFRSELGNVPLIAFKKKGEEGFGDDWPPLKRCIEVAKRAQEFTEKRIISYLTVEKMPNRMHAICVSRIDWAHLELPRHMVRLVITVHQNENPDEFLASIKGLGLLDRRVEPIVQ